MDSNWQGQERCKGMRTCKLMITLTHMHPHHCNSSANVLKRASSCQRGIALLGDRRENYSSLHNESKWWRGSLCTSVFKTALLSCAAFRWKNDPRSSWQHGQLKSLPPSLLALHGSCPPPKHSLQLCHNNCFLGLNAGLDQVTEPS